MLTCIPSGVVRDKVVELEWRYLDVTNSEHWQKMKKIMMETAQHIRGISEGPCRLGSEMRKLLKQLRKRR